MGSVAVLVVVPVAAATALVLCLASCLSFPYIFLLTIPAVHEECAQTARPTATTVASLVLGIEDAASRAALCTVQLAAQVDGFANPERVDSAARTYPVAEQLCVVVEVAA